MKTFTSAAETRAALPTGPWLSIGNFDGIHLGHRALLERGRTRAEADGRPYVVVSFRPHPAVVLGGRDAPPSLSTDEQEREILASLGVDAWLLLPFDETLASTSAEAFVDEVLIGGLDAAGVVVGHDFRFGAGRRGDLALLRKEVVERDWSENRVEGMDAVRLDGQVVSSSWIRELVAAGEVARAREALGRPFTLPGEVVTGEGRGRTIGVPTANLAVDTVMLPGVGVYVTCLHHDGEYWPSVTNVGRRPTFDGEGVTVECHVLDTTLELVGARPRLAFLKRLREERKFADADELVEQLGCDQDDGRDYFQRHPPEELRGVVGC